jgi:hypothetical protein
MASCVPCGEHGHEEDLTVRVLATAPAAAAIATRGAASGAGHEVQRRGRAERREQRGAHGAPGAARSGPALSSLAPVTHKAQSSP